MLDTKRGTTRRFQLILIKPSHYDADGYVVQWLRSTMPSNSLAAVFSLANGAAERSVLGPDLPIDVIAIDETNTRVVPKKLDAPHRRTMAGSAWSASSACNPTNSPARSISPGRCARPASR